MRHIHDLIKDLIKDHTVSNTQTSSDPSNASVAEAQPVKGRNYTLFMLVLIFASSHVDRQIIAVLAESIKLDLLLSDSQLGFLIGLSFALFYATLGIPIAFLADRKSRKNIITAAVIIWSFMTALSGLAANYLQLALARIGVGIGEAGSSPPSHSMISDLFPLEQRARAMGIFASGINLGILIGFLGGGWIDQLYGWRVAFFVVGIPGIILGIVFFFTVKEPPRSRGHQPHSGTMIANIVQCFRTMMSIPSQRHILIGCTIANFVGYGTLYWNGVYFRRILDLSPAETGMILALAGGVIGAFGNIFSGWITDKLGAHDRRYYVWTTALAKFIGIPLTVTFYLSDNIPLVFVIICIGGFLAGFSLPSSFAMTQSLMPPAQRALAASLLLFTINIIGLGLGPFCVGVLSDLLTPAYGEAGLRYALVSVSMLGIWGGYHYIRAGRTLREDLARQNG